MIMREPPKRQRRQGALRHVWLERALPFLYTVMFEIGKVFDRPGNEKLCLDVHEEWLMPV